MSAWVIVRSSAPAMPALIAADVLRIHVTRLMVSSAAGELGA